jgi:hypothetical protein
MAARVFDVAHGGGFRCIDLVSSRGGASCRASRQLLSMMDVGMGTPPPKFGPNVDSATPQPNTSLSDPGVGLRNNGRRVLTYADLHTIGGSLYSREPGRDIRLHRGSRPVGRRGCK